MKIRLFAIILSMFLIVQLIGIVNALTISSVDVSPEQIEPGQTAEITIDLKNNFDSAEFKIFISDNAPGILNMPVELSYRDAANNELKETKSLELNVYRKEEAISLGLLKRSNSLAIMIIIVVLILVYIIYRIIRKRRRQKTIR